MVLSGVYTVCVTFSLLWETLIVHTKLRNNIKKLHSILTICLMDGMDVYKKDTNDCVTYFLLLSATWYHMVLWGSLNGIINMFLSGRVSPVFGITSAACMAKNRGREWWMSVNGGSFQKWPASPTRRELNGVLTKCHWNLARKEAKRYCLFASDWANLMFLALKWRHAKNTKIYCYNINICGRQAIFSIPKVSNWCSCYYFITKLNCIRTTVHKLI